MPTIIDSDWSKFVPVDFNKYQQKVAIALMDNFQFGLPDDKDKQFFGWDYQKESPFKTPFAIIENNHYSTNIYETKVGSSSAVLLPTCIHTEVEIIFTTNRDTWVLHFYAIL